MARAHNSRYKLIKWAFGYKCAYCGGGVGTPLTMDHVVPIAKGGFKGALNCVAACIKCNGEKGDLHLGEFLAKYEISTFQGRCEIARKRLLERMQSPGASQSEYLVMKHWRPISGLTNKEVNLLGIVDGRGRPVNGRGAIKKKFKNHVEEMPSDIATLLRIIQSNKPG